MTTAVFNLEVVMACEGKLSWHEENHAWRSSRRQNRTEATAAFLLHSSAQDVSAANVGSMATLSRSS